MNPSIFKSYDIRALCPQEFVSADVERIARALVYLYHPKRVVIGRDMRETSPELEMAAVKGFSEAGVEICQIGLCSTPMFNFAVGEQQGRYDLGFMITASHNPAQYNGIKLVDPQLQPIGMGSGLERLRDLCVSNEQFSDANAKGLINKDENVLVRYLNHVFAGILLTGLPPGAHVVVDAGNGMAGAVLPAFIARLPSLQFEPLYWELDGRFPNHEANPLKADTLEVLKKRVVETQALCGFAFDGDADRIGVVDEQGEQIPGDLLMALLARELLRTSPGMRMLYDVRSSQAVPELVSSLGGIPEMYRVGSAHIKRHMAEVGAIFGGELSMHFYFSHFHNCESGDYVILLILQLLAREQKPLSSLWHDLRRYGHSGERNFLVADTKAILAELEAVWSSLEGVKLTHIDGIRIDEWHGSINDWWCGIRASNTEPLLRVVLETRDPRQLSTKLVEIEAVLRRIDPTLTSAHS